jgi:hypothetical protein
MEFKTRHQAQAWVGVLTLAGMHMNLISSETLMLILPAYVGIFAWDKVEKAVRPRLQGFKK